MFLQEFAINDKKRPLQAENLQSPHLTRILGGPNSNGKPWQVQGGAHGVSGGKAERFFGFLMSLRQLNELQEHSKTIFMAYEAMPGQNLPVFPG